MRPPAARLVSAAIALALSVMPLGVSAMAGNGQQGVHVLIDSPTWPGAICFYPDPVGDDVVRRVTVRAPIVYAYDATSRVDSQWVGWRFKVQESRDQTIWHDLPGVTTRFALAAATDAYNAQWPAQHARLPGGLSDHYRVVIAVRWYAADKRHVVAKATMSPTNYVHVGPGMTPFLLSECEASLG